jgi:hypothetical protein
MNDLEKRFQNLPPEGSKHSIWLFFLAFSRFEYALKRSGFVRGSSERVEADWDGFASEHRYALDPDSDPGLRAAVNYFEAHPPKKQILRGKRLSWGDSAPRGNEPLLCWLIQMLRRVRNNLFHGGKFPSHPIEDPARDPLLIDHSLMILKACLALNREVERHFAEPLDS